MNPYLEEWGLTESQAIEFLYRHGHFWSPDALRHGLVVEGDLPRLTLEDEIVKAAVRSYQTWFKPAVDQFALRPVAFGGLARLSIADGEIGLATAEVLTLPRCGVPDYANPEDALEANWPDPCRLDITTSFRMTLPGATAEQIAALWQEADANWQRVLEVGFRFLPDEYPNTRFWAHAASLPGSTLAWHQLAVNNCSARLEGAYDSTTTWGAALLVTTITHEHGHGLGFQHVNNPAATMYPSITQTSMARRGAVHAADLAEARRNGYRERVGPPPPPPPPPGAYRVTLESSAPIRVIAGGSPDNPFEP